MNIALIIAGGSGTRMQQDIPKQFLNVDDKPVIIHTLEVFQKHASIDGIVVVCLAGWHDILTAYCKQFNISKLAGVVEGGENGQESIYNGLCKLKELYHEEDMILIHDAIRPMISEEIISNNLRIAIQNGNAITAIPCLEAMLVTDDGTSATTQIKRDNLRRTQTPQSLKLKTLDWAHMEAKSRGITDSIATCTLLIELGHKVFFSLGSEKNVKLTTPEDIEIFKSLLVSERAYWMK